MGRSRSRDWTRCQRMIHHEQYRYQELKSLATSTPINLQPTQDYIHAQTEAANAFQQIEQVSQELSMLQKEYMLHINPSELGIFMRGLLKLRFKTKGKAKLHALVEELRQYNDCIERRLDRLGRPPQNPIPQWPPPVQRLY